MNLDKLPQKRPSSDAGKPYSITEMPGGSFDSNGSYSPGLKSANHPQSSDDSHASQNKPVPRPETLASPIDCLPKNQPIPEAFRLQLEMDKIKEQIDTHKYENVSCKLEKQMKQVYVSDPKKLAEIEKADREFNAPPAAKKSGSEYPASDYEKVKAIEEFDRKNMGEDKSTVNEPVESEYASDPKKLALIEGQDKMLTNASAVESHVHTYENVPPPVTVLETKEHTADVCVGGEPEGYDLDSELADITGKAQKGDSSMMDLFRKFDDLKQDDQFQYGAPDDDFESEDFLKFDFEKDDSETSTLTESIDNDLDSFHLSEINEDDLFARESQVVFTDSTQQRQQKPKTMEENLEEHQKKLARYTEMTSHSAAGSREQKPADTAVDQFSVHNICSQTGNAVTAGQPRGREPTEHDHE